MGLRKGAAFLYDWLRQQKAGTIVSYEEIMNVVGWTESSLKTYIGKNKIAPFLQPLRDQRLKVLLDGDGIDEAFFHETFTQTAPKSVSPSVNDIYEGDKDTYTLVEPLGNGAVGHVWSAKPQNCDQLVAVKIMLPKRDLLQDSKLPNVRERFRREASNGHTLDHPNVVKYLDKGEVDKNPFLVMELGIGSIASQIKSSGKIAEDKCATIIACCINGLEYLHNKECPHRDVKPANLLAFSNTIKLGDLGIVKWSDFDETFTKGGTITRQSIQLGSWFYMAPEQQESPHDATCASDVYALGVSWIEMLTGDLPSPQAIGAGAYNLPNMRDEVEALIRRMCSYNPDKRPDLAEIHQTISSVYS
jgi:serine/threonine-protein kinase